MVLPLLVVLVLALALAMRAVGGVHLPDSLERLYLVLAPVPLALSLLLPAVIGLVWGFGVASKTWINRFSWLGVGLSLILGLTGAALISRAVQRGQPWGWPLGSAVMLAAGPVLVVLLSYALLSLATRLP